MTSWKARQFTWSLCLLLSLPLFPQTQYRVQDHDLRLAVDTAVPNAVIGKFYNVYYGDTIRMGEFSCGDPLFRVNINEVPTLTLSGWQNGGGAYGTRVALNAG